MRIQINQNQKKHTSISFNWWYIYSITVEQKGNSFAKQFHDIFKPHQDMVGSNEYLI